MFQFHVFLQNCALAKSWQLIKPLLLLQKMVRQTLNIGSNYLTNIFYFYFLFNWYRSNWFKIHKFLMQELQNWNQIINNWLYYLWILARWSSKHFLFYFGTFVVILVSYKLQYAWNLYEWVYIDSWNSVWRAKTSNLP